MLTGWLECAQCAEHAVEPGHPESSQRLVAIREGLVTRGLHTQLDLCSDAPPVDQTLLERVHDAAYIRGLAALCQQGGGWLDADTKVAPKSWDAALGAAGAAVYAVEQVLSSRWRRAFCAVRPPGHHALHAQGMGFCLVNNIAIAARAALDAAEVQRVAILDWDVHHGNGTQAIFWTQPNVLYASWHQYPFYPGTGAQEDIGAGAGRGTTVNCPIAEGAGDAAYWEAWQTRIRPALSEFMPDLLLLSAGFDADYRDPLGGLRVSTQGFERLSAAVMSWADAHCSGRVVSVLEGGYDLKALSENVATHVATML